MLQAVDRACSVGFGLRVRVVGCSAWDVHVTQLRSTTTVTDTILLHVLPPTYM